MRHLSHAWALETALEVTQRWLARFADTPSELAAIRRDPGDLELDNWLINIPLHGDIQGHLLLSTSDTVMLAIASDSLDTEWTHLDGTALREVHNFTQTLVRCLRIKLGAQGQVLIGNPQIRRTLMGLDDTRPAEEATSLRLDLRLPDHRPAQMNLHLLQESAPWHHHHVAQAA